MARFGYSGHFTGFKHFRQRNKSTTSQTVQIMVACKSLIQKPIKTKAIIPARTPTRTPTRIRVPAKKPQESFYEETTRAVEVELSKIDNTVIDEITNKLMSLHGSVKSVVKNEMTQANEKSGIFSIPRFQRTYANIAKQLSDNDNE